MTVSDVKEVYETITKEITVTAAPAFALECDEFKNNEEKYFYDFDRIGRYNV